MPRGTRIELPAPAAVLSWLLGATFAGPAIPPKTAEEMRWDDDGGVPFPDGYEHVIEAAPEPYLTLV